MIFETPEPIELRVKIGAGHVRIDAVATAETTVEVRPADPGSRADVEHAERTRVEQRDGTMLIDAPDVGWRIGRSPAITVEVTLPEGSRLSVATASAPVRTTGRVGPAHVKTASGSIRVEHAETLDVETASGDVDAELVAGDAKLTSASGDVSVREVGGQLQVATASGDASVVWALGEVRLKTASGDARIETASDSVTARTASGDLEIGAAHRGSLSLDTASGDVRVGVPVGTTAWLDVRSLSGDVRSSLDDADGPAEGDETVRIRARTVNGDIAIARPA